MKIRVAHITLSMDIGGIEYLIYNLAKYTHEKDCEIDVLCLDYGGELVPELEKLGVNVYCLNRKPGIDISLINRLRKLFKKNRYDVVHAHNQACAFYSGLAAFLSGTSLNMVTEHSRHHIENRKKRILEKKIISFISDYWVVVSEHLYSKSLYSDNISKKKLLLINNGIDIERFENAKRYLAESETVNLVMVSRLNTVKNHEMMLVALSTLKDDSRSYHLTVVGDGPEREFLESKAKELHLCDHVSFVGNSNNVAEYLASSHIFVMCSHSEGFPLSLLEAAASRLPVILTETSNMSGFVQNQLNGIIVEKTVESLVSGIKDCATNYDKSIEMAEKLFEAAKNGYSIEKTSKEYLNLYLSKLGRSAS